MKQLFFLLTLLASGIAHAQKITDPKPFANLITAEGLKNHLYVVASKDFEGRETATEGQRKAAAYIEDHFKSFGLAPGNNGSYQLYYPVFRDSLANATIDVNGTEFKVNDEFAANIGSNYSSTLF